MSRLYLKPQDANTPRLVGAFFVDFGILLPTFGWGFKILEFSPASMIKFTTTLLQFGQQGEKTGWTYIQIPAKLSDKLKPGNKKSYRVKGKIDSFPIEGIALLPMGEGDFIMAINAAMRKGIRKSRGATVKVELETHDKFEIKLPRELMECLEQEPAAISFFKTLAKGHQSYFIKWVVSAKTIETKAKRMAQMIAALAKKQDFGMMLRSLKQNRSDMAGY
jgi:hypothetical protein